MNAEQFHNEAIRYIRRVAAKALSFNGNGLDWDLVGEPLLRLFSRAADDAVTANPFSVYLNSDVTHQHDEAVIGLELSLLSDCDWTDAIDVVGVKKLSDALLAQMPMYDADDVLETVAAIERSCAIVREKLAAA